MCRVIGCLLLCRKSPSGSLILWWLCWRCELCGLCADTHLNHSNILTHSSTHSIFATTRGEGEDETAIKVCFLWYNRAGYRLSHSYKTFDVMPMPPRAVVCSVLLRGVGIRPWPSLPADYLVSVSLWCWCPLSLGSTRGDGMSLAQVFVLIWCWWLVTTFCWLSLNIINHKTRSPQIEPLGTLKPRNRSVM